MCCLSGQRPWKPIRILFKKYSQRTDFEDVISLSDKPDLHPDTTITLTEEEKLYI